MEFDEQYTRYQLQRSAIRRFIRHFYMKHTLQYVKGVTLDLGCGVGDLLKLLPKGSLGLEVNEATVAYCRTLGLPVQLYTPESDQYQLKAWKKGDFRTLVVSHDLEHLDRSDDILRHLLNSCHRLEIERVIIVVPGLKGFHHDETHRTFIDAEFLEENGLQKVNGYCITAMRHFPFNASWVGRYFTHNELLVVYDRR